MNIQILHLLDGAKQAKGLTVIIDVFRAFTAEVYMMGSNAKKIIPVAQVQEAFDYKKSHKNAILCGEREGRMVAGFDFGNSPSQIQKKDLTGKTVVHTTSAGTQGIAAAIHADEIITGSLVNARAIATYIKRKNPSTVSLVCMGLSAREETPEDTLCALYIKSLLENTPMADIQEKAYALRFTSGKKFFDPLQQDAFPREDFPLCIETDIAPFVLRLNADSGALSYMERIDIL